MAGREEPAGTETSAGSGAGAEGVVRASSKLIKIEDATGPLSNHGGSPPRGQATVARSSLDQGRYGRMFRTLPPLAPPDDVLAALADTMADEPTLPGQAPVPFPANDNPDIPAGYTYLGQFVDHDLTFDPVSSLERQNDPDALTDFRTPRFDLDSLYGRGPLDSPYLYDNDDTTKLLVGENTDPKFEPVDLPRNRQGRALIGDPRNDIHFILSQLHLAFIRFHNACVDHLRMQFFPVDQLFEEARRLTRWHYQWVVVHDFLRHLVGDDMLGSVLVADPVTKGVRADLRFFHWRSQPFMPVEFTAAAYRFGHSMVRAAYRLNATLDPLPVLSPSRSPNPLQHLGGFRFLPKTWTIDWSLFYPVGASTPQPSRRLDTHLSAALRQLPDDVDADRRSLGLLNMLRGRALGLPSGQAVAAAMGTSVPDASLHLDGEAPLWFYLLRESEVVAEGRHLGPTTGRIVAEVILGLLAGDPSSYLRMAPAWTPELPSATPGDFTIVDLLQFAGVAGAHG
ncbi:MAG: heme peroxidase family protein [Acidimicrobiales bacterium]